MKKLIAMICGLVIIFTGAVSYGAERDYWYWDFEKETWELTEEGQELWDAAVKARKENPAANKRKPKAYPYRQVERLTFKADVKGKYLVSVLDEVAGSGSTITGSITQYQKGSSAHAWYLSLKGEGGTQVFGLGVPSGFEGFNHNTTGSIMEFPTYQYIDEDGHSAYDKYYYKKESDYSYYIYVRGTPRNNEVESLQIWLPVVREWDEERGEYIGMGSGQGMVDGEFYTDREGQSDVLDCYDIEYEYTGDPAKFQGGRNLYTLLGVSHDVDAYIEEMNKKIEFEKKYAYYEGPENNHKKPLRYKSWNGQMDGGYYQWDFNMLFAGKADVSGLDANCYNYLKGIGKNASISVVGLETTRDGQPYDCPYPMVQVKGSRDEVWFDISQMAVGSDNGETANNPKAVYVKLYKLKDFRDFVKYEDLTKDDDEIVMVLYFKDDKMTRLDKLVFDFGPTNTGNNEPWTISADKFEFSGDVASLMKYDNMDTDYFGEFMESMGIII